MSISFWEQDIFHKPYDVVIIGAGITGCSIALELKKNNPDIRILMLEKNFYPSGASTRNAGFACFGSVSELLDDLQHTPESEVKNLVRRRYEGLELLRESIPAEVMDFKMCGGYELFTDATHFDQCRHSIGLFNDWLEDIAGLKNTYSATEANGYPVIFNRYEGYLHSGKLIKWLHRQLSDMEVDIRWSCMVKSVRSGVVTLESDSQIESSHIILATNGYTSTLFSDIQIKPARGYVFVTSELEEMPWKGAWHFDKGFIYFRDVGNNRLLLGGARNIDMRKEETIQDKVNPLIKAHLIQFMLTTLRLKGNWKIEHEWTGIMGFSGDKSPFSREIKENVWVAGGLSGMGVALGMQFGKDVAHKINI